MSDSELLSRSSEISSFFNATELVNNSTKFENSLAVKVVVTFIYSSLACLALAGNLFVIVAVALNGNLRTRIYVFFVNLAVVDFITGFFVIPLQFPAATWYYWPYGRATCLSFGFVKEMCTLLSAYTLVAISIERYKGICWPIQSRTKFSKWYVIFGLAGIWLHAFVASIPWMFLPALVVRKVDQKNVCSLRDNIFGSHNVVYREYMTYLFVAEYLLPSLLMSVMYGLVIRRLMEISPGVNSTTVSNQTKGNLMKKRVAKMSFWTFIVFFICWLPIQMFNIVVPRLPFMWGTNTIHITWFIHNILSIPSMMNSCANPIIYCLMNEHFRKEFRQISRCKIWFSKK